jgi:hypothetical protein
LKERGARRIVFKILYYTVFSFPCEERISIRRLAQK